MKRISLLLSLIFAWQLLFAQLDDSYLRQRINLNWNLNKKWSLYGFYRIDYKENFSTFRRSNIQLGFDFKYNKYLSAGLDYRFGTSYVRDFHRLRARLELSYKLNSKISLTLRNMLQHDVAFLDADYFASYQPEWILRNRLSGKYQINNKISAGIFTELFTRFETNLIETDRLRTGIKWSYLYKRRHGLSLYYFLQTPLDGSIKKPDQVFGIDYTFEIEKKKKKKKKKSTDQHAGEK